MEAGLCRISELWRLWSRIGFVHGSVTPAPFALGWWAVGPVPIGVNAFDFIAPAPAHHLLPSDHPDDIMGVTVIIIAAAYRDKEFVRVGYYVNTYYEDEALTENPGDKVIWEKLHRNVLIEKPKVTR
jgi:histone chaperone ASF1